ncbi:MAG TPA: outer membrane protein assembly factor BamD [Bdellovibrionales bacterium]|nr:outer membrane protein assembly factor BamD [Bdellovibrionales bacterium]
MKILRHIALLPGFVLILGFASISLTSGCSSTPTYDTSTPEGAFKSAEELEKDERYEEAIARYGEVKNKHPYSKLATEAELRIADIQFTRESYVDAQGAYQLFKEFHPKHPRIDYVTFRLALSYYNQLPSTIDRDLSLAEKAILYFDETINSYPSSKFVKESKEKREAALKMLGEKEMYIAAFYTKRDMYESALKRFEYILKTYPNLGFDAPALYGAAKSAFETGEKERGNQHLKNLYSLYPSSDEAKRAKDDFGSN